ncbi:MAG: helix-hairpin-helix domain-containing protein [Candidatus Auribacterota bacterium]|nr:helix-hairpin-helix domain-containing protein [Candidatus Auribacterota bacterium]
MKTKPIIQLLLVSFILTLSFASNPAMGEDKLVDLNIAPSEELQTLPGVGPVLAQRIITDREANGPFQSPSDITRVFGFGDKKFQSIRALITVSHLDGGIPRRKEIKKINLNTATQVELENLPGIGPAKARRIIEFREKQGGFQRDDEITKVWGIGQKTYESMKNLITVRGGTPPPTSIKKAPPSGPRILKCWRCGKKFTVKAGVTSGRCPFCDAKWKAK